MNRTILLAGANGLIGSAFLNLVKNDESLQITVITQWPQTQDELLAK